MNTTLDLTTLFAELEESVRSAAETYSNVHRGSGHFSQVTSHLFELARAKILASLGLNPRDWFVIFCTPRRAEQLREHLAREAVQHLSSESIGLAMGVSVVAVKRKAVKDVPNDETGGGTARLVAPGWVVWAKGSRRFEAGTPAIINVVALARAYQLLQQHGAESFGPAPRMERSVEEILYHDDFNHLSGRDLLETLRRSHLGYAARVPTRMGTMPFINFDNAASTPTFPPILDAFVETLRQPVKIQRAIVREVESICASALGAPPADYDLFFASNTTEGVNLVARVLSREHTGDVEPVVLNTWLEHNSNELPWRTVGKLALIRLAVDMQGFIDLRELEAVLQAHNQDGKHGKRRVRVVAVSAASNVLGTCNDLGAICRIAHQYGARVLVDAAQLVGHRRVDMQQTGIDYLVFSAHKMYAPFGSGALVARKGLLDLGPGEIASIRESAEANAAGIAAMGKAFVLLQRIGMDVVQAEEQLLTAYAVERLSTVPGMRIYGVESPSASEFTRRGGVISLSLGMSMPSRLASSLAEQRGIGVRYGCHCAHLLVKRLHKVPPMIERLQWLMVSLFPNLELPGLLRVSLGIQNDSEQVDDLVAALSEIAGGREKGKPRQPRSSRASGREHSRAEYKRELNDYLQLAARRVYG
jgi:selenocysteine lyase/cysteine desulfurase